MLKPTWKPIGIAVAGAVALALMITGMLRISQGDPSNVVAATRVDGAPALLTALCEDEGVDAVFITDSDDNTLWRVDATGKPSSDETFVVGKTPNGFKESVPLDGELPHSGLAAWVLTSDDIEIVSSVSFQDVKEGEVWVEGSRSSPKRVRDDRFCG